MSFTEYLAEYITDNKKGKIEKVMKERTRYMTVVLEDIFQPQNASAVVRSCDCFGVQDLHVIENKFRYNVNPKVVMGASKWIDIHQYGSELDGKNHTKSTLKSLKNKGYRIVATTPHTDDVSLEEFDVSTPFALVFGTEYEGISDDVREEADEFLKIPMYGFTESFNISVSASLCMQHLSFKMRNEGVDFRLSDEEKEILLLRWYKKIVTSSEQLKEVYLSSL